MAQNRFAAARARKNTRKKIEWKDPQTGPVIAKVAQPNHYVAPRDISDELAAALVIGGAVMACVDLDVSVNKGTYPFTPIERCHRENAPIPRGSLLVYTGEIRVTEKINRHSSAQVLKHTFITPLGRCIIHDLALVRPFS